MSKKGFADYAILEYRVERIADAKRRLKLEAGNMHRGTRLIVKKIHKKRAEENLLWQKLHSERREAQRKGLWNANYDRVMENVINGG